LESTADFGTRSEKAVFGKGSKKIGQDKVKHIGKEDIKNEIQNSIGYYDRRQSVCKNGNQE
jgi:hypothetical protein